MKTIYLIALWLITSGALAVPDNETMTLAEAKRLSPSQLARILLGRAGASGDYVEAKVNGNGGIMIPMPGLNSVDLYKKPMSAGFDGLCEVEGLTVQFSSSRYDATGDPPHHVSDFWKFKRFAWLEWREKQPNSDQQQDRDCAALAPVADRNKQKFFGIKSDLAVDASFALQAISQARFSAKSINGGIKCTDHNVGWTICADPTKALRDIRVGQIGDVRVDRCEDSLSWCVAATWVKSRNGNEISQVELRINTDALRVDPPVKFDVIGIEMAAEILIED